MSSDSRRYQLKARAQRQQQTRDRIVEATEQLHREVGPSRTTIADIARRAGVERLTVYNNFPQLGDLLAACQGRFLAGHPRPELMPPEQASDPVAQLESTLLKLYGWYRANEAIQANVDRDRRLLPELDSLLHDSADRRIAAAAEAYARLIATAPSQRVAVRRLVGLALSFRTWQQLAAGGATDREIASLLARATSCSAASPGS